MDTLLVLGSFTGVVLLWEKVRGGKRWTGVAGLVLIGACVGYMYRRWCERKGGCRPGDIPA